MVQRDTHLEELFSLSFEPTVSALCESVETTTLPEHLPYSMVHATFVLAHACSNLPGQKHRPPCRATAKHLEGAASPSIIQRWLDKVTPTELCGPRAKTAD